VSGLLAIWKAPSREPVVGESQQQQNPSLVFYRSCSALGRLVKKVQARANQRHRCNCQTNAVRVDSTSAYAVVESSPCALRASSNGVYEAAAAAAAATPLLVATSRVVMAESVEEVTAYTARCRGR
jgi:hypothetical protein